MSAGPDSSSSYDETPRWKRASGVKADINVTPLVDVVLVLLIIFMVVTPQMEAGVSVNLPRAANPDATKSDDETPLTVSVGTDGGMYLEKERLVADEMRARLEKLHAATPDKPVVLRADENAAYESVRAVFKVCQDVGFPGVSFQVTEPAKG